MNDDELSKQLKTHATRFALSQQLRASVRTQIALEAAANADHPSRSRSTLTRILLVLPRVGWRSAFTGFVSGVALTLALSWWTPYPFKQDELSAELVADHVRVLKIGPLIEVASSDRHTVKPWFQGKLDYAPPVFDLESDGFPLLGGRIERVAGSPAAVLAYASRKHIINVFIWPADRELSPTYSQRSGFNVVHWSDRSMQAWVVSDLDRVEIERFGQIWRDRAASR